MLKLLVTILKGTGSRRGFAERPSSKKIALKKQQQNEGEVTVVETKLPAIGEALKNVNIFVGQSDPILLADSEYPDWIWKARGPCRAALKNVDLLESTDSTDDQIEQLAKLKKYLRTENRKGIRRNNDLLKGSSQ